jgi:hypothetical protein
MFFENDWDDNKYECGYIRKEEVMNKISEICDKKCDYQECEMCGIPNLARFILNMPVNVVKEN